MLPPGRVAKAISKVPKAAEALGKVARAIEATAARRVPNPHGSRGGPDVVEQLNRVRDEFLAANPGFIHANGGYRVNGTRLPEEYLPGPLGRQGSARPDLTFQAPDGSYLRINTVDTLASGWPTRREMDALYRIYAYTGEPVVWIPKP
jgi:hypothetical protein